MDKIAQKVVAGDVRAVARLIRQIDDNMPGVREILKELYSHTGGAYVVGITGSPGVGKSTLVDQIISHLRKQNKTVGVLAVDPTSPFSGGAVLGDRIRMQRHASDEDVFIRSLATRGQFGGLTQSTRGAIDVLDAMGKDYILVETVGVGQDEIDIVKNAHTTVVVVMPEMGDDIQVIKAGILEVADVFVINKADREGADRTENHLKLMLEMEKKKYEDRVWVPPVLRTEAVSDKGVESLIEEIERHGQFLSNTKQGLKIRKSKEKVRDELAEMLNHRLIEKVTHHLSETGDFEKAVTAIVDGTMDPYTACDDLVQPFLDSFSDHSSND